MTLNIEAKLEIFANISNAVDLLGQLAQHIPIGLLTTIVLAILGIMHAILSFQTVTKENKVYIAILVLRITMPVFTIFCITNSLQIDSAILNTLNIAVKVIEIAIFIMLKR